MINIIGGSGFIGTSLCKLLDKDGTGFRIIDIVKSDIFPNKTTIADVRDYQALVNACDKDTIINLAAEHRDDVTPKRLYDEVNVDGARRTCEVAEVKGIKKIIFTSSVAVYGFAPPGTGEDGELRPFNDYGRTKMEAEKVYKEWQSRDKCKRTLVIIRPTVVFGEMNRGNVYNLLHQISKGHFIMVGDGKNVKSMAYVENISTYLKYALSFKPGLHLYNYIDKPDLDMNTLIINTYQALGRNDKIKIRIPYSIAYTIGKLFDATAHVTGKKFSISSIRIKKFCSNTMFNTSISENEFKPPVKLVDGLNKTIKYEFIDRTNGTVYYTE